MLFKTLIKVPLVLAENIFFSIFPRSRAIIEKYIFNPYRFNEKHIEYSKNQFADFLLKIGGMEKIREAQILELGPGGSIGFGLMTLANGASKYYAIDDGIHTFITSGQMDGYRKMLKKISVSIDDFFISAENGKFRYNNSKINFIKIDQNSTYSLPENSIDLIYSCAVLEHVHNLDLAFSEMTRILKSGGIMNHQIDLRDHIFSQKSLWFLKIKEKWFKLLFGKTGEYVNRKRLGYYYGELFQKNNLEVINLEKNIVYNKVFPKKLADIYSKEDLETLSFNIVLRKKSCAE